MPDAGTSARVPSEEAKHRGKGFPIVPLAEAVRVLKEAGKYNTEHSITAFASYMGNASTTSGAFKRGFAAYRDWKLITTDGGKVRMTELGRRIAIPPDPSKEQDDLRRVFLGCEVFASTYRNSAKGVSLDPGTIGNNAVHEQGVSVVSKQLFAKSFSDSAIAAGLAERLSDGKIRLLAEPQDGHDPDLGAVTPDKSRGRKDHLLGSLESPLLHMPWQVKGGQLVFEVWLDRPLPVQAFGKLETIAKAVEDLGAILGVEGKDNGDSSAQ